MLYNREYFNDPRCYVFDDTGIIRSRDDTQHDTSIYINASIINSCSYWIWNAKGIPCTKTINHTPLEQCSRGLFYLLSQGGFNMEKKNLTWQQEAAITREQDNEKVCNKIFKGIEYPDHLTEQNIDDSQWLVAWIYKIANFLAGALLLIGAANQLFGQAIIAAIILNCGSKWICRKLAIKAAEFYHGSYDYHENNQK